VIIRINPDGTTPSGFNKGPFFDVAGGNASLERMYAYGVRNSFGIGFDPMTAALWDTENGPGDYDEVNRCDAAFNSGWEDQMGPTGFPNVDKSAPGKIQFGAVGTYVKPKFSWRQTVAPTSIHFLTSTAPGASSQFDCFVGDSNNGFLYRFEPNGSPDGFVLTGGLADTVLDITAGDNNTDILFGFSFGTITDIETGPDGALYVLSIFGQLYRIFDPILIPVELSGYRVD
jgi:glucose/arabinose dehydrogenase